MLQVIEGGFTAVEEARFRAVEEGMECAARSAWVEWGTGLREIRDSRLYRAQYATFEDYCRMRWSISRQRAYQLIASVEVVANVSTVVDILPGCERQARELSRLEPEGQRQVWAEIAELAERGDITPRDIRLSIERRIAVKVGRSGAQPTPALPTGTFSLIYADPPWQYDFSNHSGKVCENHYPTMTTEAICDLAVSDVAAPNCILFLWATNPKLKDALAVVEAWGFDYKTNAAWEKTGLGLGYYFRQNHELLLVATRGQPGVPTAPARPPSVIHAKKGRHSEKPDLVRDLLNRMYPGAHCLELFARKAHPGWAAWGNQLGEAPI